MHIFNNGQSNAARTTTQTDPRITVRRPNAAPTTEGIPAVAFGFAKAALDAGLATSVEILDTAKGGQSIRRYIASDADPELWNRVTTVYAQAGSPQIAAEIFVQGEADHAMSSLFEYRSNRLAMLAQLRALIGHDFPNFGSVPYNGRRSRVSATRADYWRRAMLYGDGYAVETADLVDDLDDGVHFNEASGMKIGQRMFGLWQGNTMHAARAIGNIGAHTTDGQTIHLDLRQPETATVFLRAGSTLQIPTAGSIPGAVIHISAIGTCTVQEVGTGGLGFYLHNGSPTVQGPSITLARGEYRLSAVTGWRRWSVA